MKKILIAIAILLFASTAYGQARFDKVHTYSGDFGGDIWYVSDVNGLDTNSGTTSKVPFKTIAVGLAACSAGDAVSVTAGTYTENVVMSTASVELWCEIGTIIDGDGTCLTVSGGTIKVLGPLKITPAADQIGVLVSTADGNEFRNVRVKGVASTTGWDFNIGGSRLFDCTASGIKAGGKGFDIGGSGTKLTACYAAGTTTSYGFFADGTITGGFLSDCISVGNQTAGYYLDDVSGMTVVDCSSGAGDGKWRDIDSANVWSGFSYPETKFKDIVIGTDGETTGNSPYNLFKITGSVEIQEITGHVNVILTGANDDVYFNIHNDDGATSNTLVTATTGTDMPVAVGSVCMKGGIIGAALNVFNAAGVVLGLSANSDKKAFGVLAPAAGNTYMQYVSSNDTSGTMHFHVIWRPLTEDGFLEVAE